MTCSARANICHLPFDAIYIGVDGSAWPCCSGPGGLEPMGNVNEASAIDLWQSGFAALRGQMVAGNPPERCRHCVLGTMSGMGE